MKRKLFITAILTSLVAAACGGVSDEELKTRAEQALRTDPTTENVKVEVKDSVATVSGEVKDDAARAKAAELAKVEGVTAVVNNVTVIPAAPPLASADDETLKTKVSEALKESACGDVEVEVSEGVVTLKGTVTQEKFAGCVMAANQAKPKKVENLLKTEN